MIEYKPKEYPPLLSASHIADALSVSRSTAYEIMRQPHRPVWRDGSKVRLHRDLFFQQLEEESKGGMNNVGASANHAS